ncbi:YqeG family HAD IIIA-type phosphatase [Desulfallas sp. Bu1-1]|uniref:YqeG family HAD IIIA-type phosphatase n=1 Tax=Desulfallas sp. Bu1-1 TaxID=2787620 RepID=UPI0018A05A65|nr:YqeG family HAD IIIA-type phosphatase [Desulfallas sp. Bu1-1]MBF7082149.1 YqeG family HAD IIIA-type phosphatase [Desulfallas sp. Bu1-1]
MLSVLYPRMYVPAIYEINPEELKKMGIRALLLDLDNTIVPRDQDRFSREITQWLQGMLEKGFKLCVVSNNSNARVRRLVGPLRIPCVVRAVKPFRHAFQRGMDLLGVKPQETAVVGDQIFTDILGGNMLGLYTILVVPMPGRDFWATRLINRPLEKLVIKRISDRVSHKDKQYRVW